MFCKRFLLIAACALSTVALADGRDGITLSHYENLERLELADTRDDVSAGDSQKLAADGISMSFDAHGRSFALLLQPNARLIGAMSPELRAAGVMPYTGEFAGIPGSWARIVVAGGVPSGLLFDGKEYFAIDRPGDSLVDAPGPVSYRLADLVIAPGALGCATGSGATTAASAMQAVIGDVSVAEAPGAITEIDIGAVGDFEFSAALGAGAEAAIVDRLNRVDGIYSEQIGVQINVPLIEIYADAADPFDTPADGVTGETDPSALLQELRDYRFGSTAQDAMGLTHLYTGRDLTGSTVGMAFNDVLCDSGWGSGLTEGTSNATLDSLVAAHEIGHNFGAEHDGEAGSSCQDVTGDWVMSPSVTGTDRFSACSIAIMEASASVAACVTALPSTDISVAFSQSSSSVLLTNQVEFALDVTNRGTEDATSVVAAVSLPANVMLASATGSSATCTEASGTVVCEVGTVAGGVTATIDFVTDTVTPGAGSYDAVVTADADDRPGNNADSMSLTVDPAVSLTFSLPASVQVTESASTSVNATLENLSPLAATGVTLNIQLNSGLQANSASWSIGSCVVAAQQVDCEAAQFDAQSSATLTLNVTGVTKGNRNYTVSLASAEADADPSDNTAQGTVRVVAEGGSDGGGSTGWLFLTLLGLVSLLAAPAGRSRLLRLACD